MSDDAGVRFAELCQHVLAPLVLGGPLQPVRPFGPTLGLHIGQNRGIPDSDLRSRIDVARVRRARLIAPIDALPPISAHEFALTAALSDLLQATNHELGGVLRSSRYARLLQGVQELIERIPPPQTVEEALARHALLCRVFELSRTDTHVRWWTGKAHFRGQKPPSRLLLWRGARRVSVTEEQVELAGMCAGFDGAQPVLFENALSQWLTRTPLTDLANLLRPQPIFRWSGPTLSLVAISPGRTLALRLLDRQKAGNKTIQAQIIAVLERAGQELPETASRAAKGAAASFLKAFRESIEAPVDAATKRAASA